MTGFRGFERVGSDARSSPLRDDTEALQSKQIIDIDIFYQF
jgi:hypothetical protein